MRVVTLDKLCRKYAQDWFHEYHNYHVEATHGKGDIILIQNNQRARP